MALILVADDHPLNRHFLATLLSYHGYGINEASDGVDALRSAREERPDLIIADVAMPRMDGFAFVTALRADADLADIPVIFYTATYRDVESRAIARAAGVEHLITKPSDPEVILETVQKALGLSSPPPRHRVSRDQLRQYADRLQRTNIRMSALIELSFELDAERDPGRLIRTACIAVRRIFDCDHAAIVLAGNEEQVSAPCIDGDVDQTALMRAGLFFGPFMRNFGDASDPIVQQMSAAMRGLRSMLVLPLTSGRDLYGTIVLGKAIEQGFASDDERLGLAAAGQIRAAHESLMLYQAQRRQATILSRAREDLESRIDERTRELRLANEALRKQMAERERIEEELGASREHLAALFDASPISIVSFDSNRITRTWNAAAERTFGWRADEVIGR
ncbi:MAG: response regulator, partial [Thermoanaerobaculia bacterium]